MTRTTPLPHHLTCYLTTPPPYQPHPIPSKNWVRDRLSFGHVGQVSVFETTIRELGGLLAAFDLSGDAVFLTKAEDLGERLLRAFNSPSGIPFGAVTIGDGGGRPQNAGWTGNAAVLSELGTLQVEFR